ncbi:hypothetical protein O181_125722 [Austropuccinia psidii MF-1]|uniref:Uncharacterized protein n=1 Tax=Austropuccinia psidii MF-1 TaxID=1389203 RepID=A0A9Q3KUJ4_9BASI|nr:hypothetical protein [Austropuccinia psidii MF-1]
MHCSGHLTEANQGTEPQIERLDILCRKSSLNPCVTTTKIDPPPWVLRQFQPGTKLGPIGHTISFMANWSPLVPYGLRPYPAIIGLLGQFPPHQPPGLHLGFWAWGGPFVF